MNLKLDRQSFGIAMILFGSPIIHFLRDFAKILPDSPLVMPIISLGWLLLIFDINGLQRIYKPNIRLLKIACWFFFIALSYAMYNFQTFKWFKECNNYFFLILYLFVLCTVSNKIYTRIFYSIIIVTFLDNIALIYAFLRNPLLKLGQRAIISSEGWGGSDGNPTLYSFMAYAGIIGCYLCFNKLGKFWKFVQILNIATGIAVIFLTMTRATFFAFGIAICLGFILNFFKSKDVFKEKTQFYDLKFSKTNFTLIVLILLSSIIFFIKLPPKKVEVFSKYLDHTFSSVVASVQTVFEGKKDKKTQSYADASTSGRVENVTHVINAFKEYPEKFILGYGYKYYYVDVPIIEVFIDLGILGIFFYLFFQIELFKNIANIYIVSDNPWLKFWYLYYCLLFMNMISRGMPYEAYFWMYYVTMIRFFTEPNLIIKNFKPTLSV